MVSLTGTGWSVVPSYSFGSLDNVLAGVSATAATDAWAVGAYYPASSNVLATLAEHFDGTRWTAYPLPNVGLQENVLLAVSMPSTGTAWAVGYYVSGKFQQQTLIEHFDGSVWSVVPSPSPGALQNILYGVAAISDSDVWAVGAEQDAHDLWHTLAEHWDGSVWSVVNAVDSGLNGNQFYAVKAIASNNIYAVGQQAGSEFPDQALIEHWDGKAWSAVNSPLDASATALPLGVTATASSLTVVGQRETDTAPYTTYVVAGAPRGLSIVTTPNAGAGENDLFGAATGADGSTWAVGWDSRQGTTPMSTLPQKLEQLSLTTMSHHLDQTIADAATNNLSFPATLERLADLELEARRRRSIERRVKMSRLQAQHSIDANVGFRLRQYPKPRTVAASPAPKDLH